MGAADVVRESDLHGRRRAHLLRGRSQPGFLWDSATWEISLALMPHLRTVMLGTPGWEADEIIGRAIEIRDGVIQNPKILSFQGRAATFPHFRL